jgi:hypothetical protein
MTNVKNNRWQVIGTPRFIDVRLRRVTSPSNEVAPILTNGCLQQHLTV